MLIALVCIEFTCAAPKKAPLHTQQLTEQGFPVEDSEYEDNEELPMNELEDDQCKQNMSLRAGWGPVGSVIRNRNFSHNSQPRR